MAIYLLDDPAGPDSRFNVGDDIQILAAERFAPHVDGLIDKHRLFDFAGPPGKMILNGWYMHDPEKWPPAGSIQPLMTSFHMNPVPAARMLERGRSFFERHSPVGCRDYQTLEIFQKAGLPAYFSGCLTLTLERERFLDDWNAPRSGTYAVDVLYKLRAEGSLKRRLRRVFTRTPNPVELRNSVETKIFDRLVPSSDRHNVLSVEHSRILFPDSRLCRRTAALEVLKLYANAKLVITSRIHCALPCLAFGTPVIFVDGGLGQESERARLRGLIELMPVLTVGANGEPDFKGLERDLDLSAVKRRAEDVEKLRDRLIKQCTAFYEDACDT